jgi:hypothetical protein
VRRSPEPERIDAVRVQFSGAHTGSLAAEGAPSMQAGTLAWQSFATGLTAAGSQETGLAALQVRGDHATEFFVILSNRQPGQFSFDESCSPSAGGCALGIVAFNVRRDGDTAEEIVYFIDRGTLVLSAVDNVRMRGTFAGSAARIDAATGAPTDERMSLAAGTFDVELRGQTFFSGARAPLEPTLLRRLTR